jgi:hypothetical protein
VDDFQFTPGVVGSIFYFVGLISSCAGLGFMVGSLALSLSVFGAGTILYGVVYYGTHGGWD